MTFTTQDILTITAPASTDGRGEVAVLNNPASGNHVGWLFKPSGFGAAPVRVSKDVLPEGNGAIFNSFYEDARSFTLEVVLSLGSTFNVSDNRYRKLVRATYALRADALLSWTDQSTVAKQIYFRREQGPTDPDENGHVLIGCIAADPLIYGGGTARTPVSGAQTSHTVDNAGNADSPDLVITIASPSATCVLTNTTTSQALTFTGLNGGGTVTVDFKNHTITQGGVSKASAISWPSSTWWKLIPGNNNLTYTNAATPTWRDAYLST